jgi:excisionase family DNA binding protein
MVALALATLDPARPQVRAEAQRIADRLAGDTANDSEVVRALLSMLDNVVQGERVTVIREDQEVTPAGAAELMGVTRQFVDRLLADGVLDCHRLPGSKHRRIRVSDVLALAAERERLTAGHAAITAAFEDMELLDDA